MKSPTVRLRYEPERISDSLMQLASRRIDAILDAAAEHEYRIDIMMRTAWLQGVVDATVAIRKLKP